MTAQTTTASITDVKAWEVLDCRGLPTLRVAVELDGESRGCADVPAGKSVGTNEAIEIRDRDERFGGNGVRSALGHVVGEIRSELVGSKLGSQEDLDKRLIDLDGTPDKSRLGGNAIIGVSLAAARAAASLSGEELFEWVDASASVLPVPLVNLINGGKHASNDLDFQEFIVVPWDFDRFSEALRASSEINLALAKILLPRYGKPALNTGDEGGYAPPLADPMVALELLHEAVEAAGYQGRCAFGLDVAATHLYDESKDFYRVAGEELDRESLTALYQKLVDQFGLVTIEDPLNEEDFDGTATLTRRLGIQIVGDDLFVTSADRVRHAASMGAGNALLWKFNQVGTLTEALEAAQAAEEHDMEVVVSERSGETEDPIIADFAVGIGASQIKTGAPVRGERTAKYNRLLEIEAHLGERARYAGSDGLFR